MQVQYCTENMLLSVGTILNNVKADETEIQNMNNKSNMLHVNYCHGFSPFNKDGQSSHKKSEHVLEAG